MVYWGEMHHQTHSLHGFTHKLFGNSLFWALALSAVIVVAASMLGRAALNMQAALTDKPEVAVYLLLEEEHPGRSTLLRATENERSYLVETASGSMLVKLRRGERAWYVAFKESLRRAE